MHLFSIIREAESQTPDLMMSLGGAQGSRGTEPMVGKWLGPVTEYGQLSVRYHAMHNL